MKFLAPHRQLPQATSLLMRLFCRTRLAASCRAALCFVATILLLDQQAKSDSPTNQIVQTGPDSFQIGLIQLNRAKRTLTFPAVVRITNEVVEYALVTTEGKTHESMFTTEVSPTQLHVAVLLLGVTPASDLGVTNSPIRLQKGAHARIDIGWNVRGRERRTPLERMILLRSSTGKGTSHPLKLSGWIYNGSFLHQGLFVAQEEGSIISLIRDPVALINNPGADRDNDDIHFPDPHKLPPKGTSVTVRLRF